MTRPILNWRCVTGSRSLRLMAPWKRRRSPRALRSYRVAEAAARPSCRSRRFQNNICVRNRIRRADEPHGARHTLLELNVRFEAWFNGRQDRREGFDHRRAVRCAKLLGQVSPSNAEVVSYCAQYVEHRWYAVD